VPTLDDNFLGSIPWESRAGSIGYEIAQSNAAWMLMQNRGINSTEYEMQVRF
jgi:hypothetical protein